MSHPIFSTSGDDGECRNVVPTEGGWQIAFTAKVLERLCRAVCVKALLVSLKYARTTRHIPYRILSRTRTPSSSRFSFATFLITNIGKKVANLRFSLFGPAAPRYMT